MSVITVKDFCFTYPESSEILRHISFSLERGEMLLLCGENGCGKTTLLRSLKPETAPKGTKSGNIFIQGESVILFQECDKNIIFKSVWEELIFPACNYGIAEKTIKTRAETIIDLFGIRHLLGRDTGTLSGGEKQLLSLASLMMLQPALLILDEPLSQLDETAKETFIRQLLSLKENGTAIIISEHHTDRLLETADRFLVFTADGCALHDRRTLSQNRTIPNAPEYLKLEEKLHFPVHDFTSAEAVKNIRANAQSMRILPHPTADVGKESVLSVHDLSFSYRKGQRLLEHLNFTLHQGEIAFMTGANGAGKSTLLSLICAFLKPDSGNIQLAGNHRLGYLAQNPVYSFLKDTLKGDFLFALRQNRLDDSLMEHSLKRYPLFRALVPLLTHNPLDISGGERAKASLFKLMMLSRDVVLLDEPEKHLDKKSMEELSSILKRLAADGMSFLIVSHSPDFIYRTADSVHELDNGTLHCYSVTDYFPAKMATSLYTSVKEAELLLLDRSETEVSDG